jgi:hypothetical protein
VRCQRFSARRLHQTHMGPFEADQLN